MMGLTLAHELAKVGATVEVLEAAAGFGGLAEPVDFGPFAWDRFYHCIINTDTELLSLLNEIGLGTEVRWENTASGFYYQGKSYSLNAPRDYLAFTPLNLFEKARLGLFVLACPHLFSGERLERETASAFLRRTCGRRVWEVVWHPLLRAKLGPAADRISARFIWDTINRLQAARRGVERKELLGYVRGGYAKVIQTMTSSLRERGVALKAKVRVGSVRSSPEGGVQVMLDGVPVTYDDVLLTISNPAAARVLRPTPAVRRLDEIEYLGVVVCGVVLRKRISPFYILNISDHLIGLTGLIGTSNLVRDGTFGEYHLYYLPRYLTQDDPFWNWEQAAREQWFLDQLGRLAPELTRADIVSATVSSARYVQPVLDCDFSKKVPAFSTGEPGVWLVNTSQCYQGPIHINLVVGHARRAVRAIFPE